MKNEGKTALAHLTCASSTREQVSAMLDELHACGLRRVEFRGISLPLPRTNRKITDNGWYGPDHPSTATVEWGTEMLNTTADFLVDYMRAFEKIPLDAE